MDPNGQGKRIVNCFTFGEVKVGEQTKWALTAGIKVSKSPGSGIPCILLGGAEAEYGFAKLHKADFDYNDPPQTLFEACVTTKEGDRGVSHLVRKGSRSGEVLLVARALTLNYEAREVESARYGQFREVLLIMTEGQTVFLRLPHGEFTIICRNGKLARLNPELNPE